MSRDALGCDQHPCGVMFRGPGEDGVRLGPRVLRFWAAEAGVGLLGRSRPLPEAQRPAD